MSDLPVSPTTKREHEEYLQTCYEWMEAVEDSGPFDEWGKQIAWRMDRHAAEHARGERR
jgi:hypothetical protein